MQVELWAKGGSVQVDYSINDGVNWEAISNSPVTLGSEFPSDSSPLVLYLDILSSRLRLRFRNNETDEALVIKQYVIGYKPREFRR